MTTRRDFLLGSLSAGAGTVLGSRLAPQWLQAAGGSSTRKLVVIQISGGWDYFSQIIPVNSPQYYAARTTAGIGIADNDNVSTLPISGSIPQKWSIALRAFKDLYDRGDLAVVNNVGYPSPNLSHPESTARWLSGWTNLTQFTDGWLGRYLRNGYTGGFQLPALDIEGAMSGAFSGYRVPVMRNPATFQFAYDTGTRNDNVLQAQLLHSNALVLRPTAGPTLQVAASGIASAVTDSALLQSTGASYTPRVTYPNSTLATDLRLAARYITAGLGTHVYYASTGGWDLHANLAVRGAGHTGTMANLLTNVSSCVKAFLDDLAAYGVDQNVVVMVFSEFSRRFGENGSSGVDHGHGGVVYLAGAPVVGGFYGTYPDLSVATTPYANWYPTFGATSTDFRSIYATILERWLNVPSAPLLGQQFPLLAAL
jgi:uncharacterized protein (DUF1501 family)